MLALREASYTRSVGGEEWSAVEYRGGTIFRQHGKGPSVTVANGIIRAEGSSYSASVSSTHNRNAFTLRSLFCCCSESQAAEEEGGGSEQEEEPERPQTPAPREPERTTIRYRWTRPTVYGHGDQIDRIEPGRETIEYFPIEANRSRHPSRRKICLIVSCILLLMGLLLLGVYLRRGKYHVL